MGEEEVPFQNDEAATPAAATWPGLVLVESVGIGDVEAAVAALGLLDEAVVDIGPRLVIVVDMSYVGLVNSVVDGVFEADGEPKTRRESFSLSRTFSFPFPLS